MSTTHRRDRGQHESMVGYYLAAAVFALLGIMYVCWRAGCWLSGQLGPVLINPATAAVDGTFQWPVASTVLLVVAVIAAAAIAVVVGRHRAATAVLREFDQVAQFLPRPRELHAITARDAKHSAQRLRGRDAITGHLDYGLVLGSLIGSGTSALYMSWEWVGLVIGGPRCGKTTGYAIPMICQAPGAVFATSNKPDIYDATRWVRDRDDLTTHAAKADTSRQGLRALWAYRTQRREPPRTRGTIWLSDLQHIAGTQGQQWWWDPFWCVHELSDARELAAIFAAAETAEGSRLDAYFDGGAKELLALHILAASVGGGDLKHVDGWLTDPKLKVARQVLTRHGHHDAAAKIDTAANLNPRQQDGLYDMARRFINVMTVPAYARSVLPPQRVRFDGDNTVGSNDIRHDLPKFDPQAFVTSTDTMYALSMEGAGSATALTTALADTIFKASVAQARRNGGRLPVPVVAVLDEAANVCKLPELPDWYSHFGSQGIVIVTMLQSLAQAAKVWSKDKLDMLVDSSNVYIYAGSSNNESYLSGLSRMIGQRDVRRRSRSHSNSGLGSTSTSESWSSEPILGIDDLKALPAERAVLATSGNRTVVTTKNSYWLGPYAELIDASKKACATERASQQTALTAAPPLAATTRERTF